MPPSFTSWILDWSSDQMKYERQILVPSPSIRLRVQSTDTSNRKSCGDKYNTSIFSVISGIYFVFVCRVCVGVSVPIHHRFA